MIRLADDLLAFAAKQSQVQADLEKTLSGSARNALRHWGQENWSKALLERAEKALRARFRVESGLPTHAAVRLAVIDFRRQAQKTLAKTTKPTEAGLYAQARALAASLATSVVNAAVIAAARADSRVGLMKVWHSMEDEKVRPSHAAANGQKVHYARNFEVGGHKMSRPGDMRAPIEEWINCRCLIGLVAEDEPAVAASAGDGSVAVLTKRDTEGVAMDPTEDDWSDFEDAGPVEIPAEDIPWYGPLAPEGVASGDGRKFAEGALVWRDLPLPFAWQRVNEPGHDGSVVVGNIQRIWRHAGLVWGSGLLLSAIPETDEFVTLVANQAVRGISVDADDAVVQFEMRDGTSVDDALEAAGEEGVDVEEIVSVFTQARICGATGCAIPAFQEAFIALGEPTEDVLPTQDEVAAGDGGDVAFEDGFRNISSDERKRLADEGKAMPDGSFPIANVEDLKNAIQSIGRAKDPEAAKAHIKKRAKELGEESLIPEDWSAVTAAAFVKTEDGPGWLTHPVDTDRLRDYWVRGPGAAKINWGTPGDFNRCRANLAKYIKPQHLSGYCANRHYDALGFWPGRPVSADTVEFSTTEPLLHLVASGDTFRPPKAWFEDPHLIGPSAITVTEDGRMFGHLAEWGTCHIGISGVCTTPPESTTDYAWFRTGAVLTAEGDHVPVGSITMDTGHADIKASAKVAMAHYDNTGTAIAEVAAGEDEFGIWVAGAVRPWATEEQIYALRAAKLSGDWRIIGNSLELVAALAVNVGGFPIPRMTLAASGGQQTALVASGIVMNEPQVVGGEFTVEEIVNRVLEAQERREASARLARLQATLGRDPKSRLKRLAAARKGAE